MHTKSAFCSAICKIQIHVDKYLFFLLELNSAQFVSQQMFPESSSTAERPWEGDVVKYFIILFINI